MAKVIVGIDTGGTFTDAVAYVEGKRELVATKVPSRPKNPAEAFKDALTKVLKLSSCSVPDVQRVIHGTTVATNAILERKGSKLGLLTTEGFEDILSIGTVLRTDMYDLFSDPETPTFLCPRRRIFGIPERMSAEGEVVVPLDEAKVRESIKSLVENYQVEGVVVCYLFSFIAPHHEIRTKEIINQLYPKLRVSLSSVVDPRLREYHRLVVTLFDAYVAGAIGSYISELGDKLKDFGVKAPFQLMKSRGGISGASTVIERPVTTILSGPAAGVIGGKTAGLASDFQNLITFDMGGTSCDVALVKDGKTELTTEAKFEKCPFRLPMVDVKTIGAGGGSIAWIDEAGRFGVGPRSAGADPGPACYGQGGDQATVTDASVVLGYLNPDYFGAGEISLVPSLAEKAIKDKIAEPLSIEVTTAAAGIHTVINSNMAQTVRLMSVERGYDPRNFALLALGGAGPVHAGRVAEELSIPKVIVPATPGVLSAFGLLMADIEHESARTHQVEVEKTRPEEVREIFGELDRSCQDNMRSEGISESEVTISRYAEMRYVGQGYELEVGFPNKDIDVASIATMAERFHDEHERVYGHCNRQAPVEFVTLRSVHVHSIEKPALVARQELAMLDQARKGTRNAYFDEYHTYVECPIFDRTRLPVGQEITGPAIIEQEDSTTVVYPGQRCRLDAHQNLIITTRKFLEGAEAIDKKWALAKEEVSPITLEVVRYRLDTIANEMQAAMLKSAYSTVVRDFADASSAVFDRRGRTLAQAVALPFHLGMMAPIVKRIIKEFPLEQMKPGDSYMMNDPYDGGTHIPDIMVVSPVFFNQQVAALTVTLCHHQDMGGSMPGSTPAEVTEIYAEGLIIPPSKFYDRGKPNETLHKMIRRNVRIPDVVMGDIQGQMAAAHVGQVGMVELLEEYGEDTIMKCIDKLMDISEQLTRAKIEHIPDGRYTFYDFVDEDSIDHDKPIKIQATVEIKGSDIYMDFEGTDPQAKGPINMVYASSVTPCNYVVRAITDPSIPNNEGCYRPLHVKFPKGSLVNPTPPAPVGIRTNPTARTVEVLLGALIQVIPDRIPAAGSHYVVGTMVGGVDPKTGKTYVTMLPMPPFGGMGARPNKDGIDVTSQGLLNCSRVPIEPCEMNYPLRILKFNLRQDSGGAGKYRGGLGAESVCQWLRREASLNHRVDRRRIAAWGVFGGEAGLRHESIILRRDGRREVLPSINRSYIAEGDQFHMLTAGGGGYGDPLERSPEEVLDDVLDKKVSLGAAREKYGVVIDPEKMTIDSQATLALRERLRQARVKPSQIFDRGPM